MADYSMSKLETAVAKLKSKNEETVLNSLLYIRHKYTKQEMQVRNFRVLGGIKYILLLIQQSNEMILNPSLSILGNCCLVDDLSRIEVRHRNGILPIVSLLKITRSDEIQNRICRTLANLALDYNNADIIIHLDAVPLVMQVLTNSKDINCQLSAIRALRLFGNISANREVILQQEGVKVLASFLRSEDEPVLIAILKSLTYFIQKFICRTEDNFKNHLSAECVRQLQDGLEDLVKLASHLNYDIKKQVLDILITLMHEPTIRPTIGNAGGVECIIKNVDLSNCNQDNLEMLNALSFCCRECINRVRVREHGGLSLLLEALSDKKFQPLHDRILFAFVSYLYDEKSLELLLDLGLISILINFLTEYIDSVKKTPSAFHDHKAEDLESSGETDDKLRIHQKFGRSNSFMNETGISNPKKHYSKRLSLDETCSMGSDDLLSGIYRANSPTYLQYKISTKQDQYFVQKKKTKDFSLSSFNSSDWSPLSTSSFSSPERSQSNSPPLCSYQYSSAPFGLSSQVSCGWSPPKSQLTSLSSSDQCSSVFNFSEENFSNSSLAEEWSSVSSDDDNDKEDSPVMEIMSDLNIAKDISKLDNKNEFDDLSNDESSIGIDLELQSLESNKELEIPDNMSEDSLPSPYLELNDKSFVGYILLLISRFSQMDDPSILVTVSCLQNLLELLSLNPSPTTRVIRIINRLTRNPLCFENFLKTQFCILVQESMNSKHCNKKCRYCQDLKRESLSIMNNLRVQAESCYGCGVMAHLLLTGSAEEKDSTALAVPYLCKNNSLRKKLLMEHGGLEVLSQLFLNFEIKEKFMSVITSFALLASDIGVNPVNLEMSIFYPSDIPCKYNSLLEPFDLEIVVDGNKNISVHRNVLSNSSELFHSMLKGNFQEASQNQIYLPDITHDALLYIIHYIYDCHLKDCLILGQSSLETLVELLAITDRFLMTKLQDYIADCIMKNFVKSDLKFAHLYRISSMHNCQKLAKAVIHHLLVGILDVNDRFNKFLEIVQTTYAEEALITIQTILKDKL